MIRTVLLVDDHPDNREIYRAFLEHLGLAVIEASNGVEALRVARERLPTVILMDMGMPVMDGWTAARLLRQDPATSTIPIIALTAHAMEGSRETALDAGCDEFLAKPIEPRKVFESIERLLAAKA